MRQFMELYPLMATLMAVAAVIYMVTMGYGGAEPLIWAALMGGLLAVPVTAVMAKTGI